MRQCITAKQAGVMTHSASDSRLHYIVRESPASCDAGLLFTDYVGRRRWLFTAYYDLLAIVEGTVPILLSSGLVVRILFFVILRSVSCLDDLYQLCRAARESSEVCSPICRAAELQSLHSAIR